MSRGGRGGAAWLAAAVACVALTSAACGGSTSDGGAAATTAVTRPDVGTAAGESKDTVAAVPPADLPCPVAEEVAARLFERAVGHLRAIPVPRVDTVWVLERVAEDHPALGIDDPLDGRGVSEPSDPAGRLVDPGVPPGPPLAQGSTPDAQLLRDFGAAFRPPGPEATAALDRFTAQPDLEGYALAHQWLALIWAEELGHRLPPDVLAREQRIEAQVRAELAEHPELPIDLWAELTALLAQHGGGLDEAARQQALCRVVGTAEAEGVWRGDGTYAQRYAGGSFDITAEPEHVTALMTWLLAALVRPA